MSNYEDIYLNCLLKAWLLFLLCLYQNWACCFMYEQRLSFVSVPHSFRCSSTDWGGYFSLLFRRCGFIISHALLHALVCFWAISSVLLVSVFTLVPVFSLKPLWVYSSIELPRDCIGSCCLFAVLHWFSNKVKFHNKKLGILIRITENV